MSLASVLCRWVARSPAAPQRPERVLSRASLSALRRDLTPEAPRFSPRLALRAPGYRPDRPRPSPTPPTGRANAAATWNLHTPAPAPGHLLGAPAPSSRPGLGLTCPPAREGPSADDGCQGACV